MVTLRVDLEYGYWIGDALQEGVNVEGVAKGGEPVTPVRTAALAAWRSCWKVFRVGPLSFTVLIAVKIMRL